MNDFREYTAENSFTARTAHDFWVEHNKFGIDE